MPKDALSLYNLVTFPPLKLCFCKLYLGELLIGGKVALNLGRGYWPNYVLWERNISCVLKKSLERLIMTNMVRMFSSSPEEEWSQVELCNNSWSQTSVDIQVIY
jgi:hypothetical protein